MSKYTTGEIAKLCGVTVRTVQYYDNRGIIIPTELSEGGRRLYSDKDLSKMKIVCFLRELDIPLNTIAELMNDDKCGEVIYLILAEQEAVMRKEIEEKQAKLDILKTLRAELKRIENPSVESIGDIAHIMEHKKKLKRLRAFLLITGLPITAAQWGTIILWIKTGLWLPFLIYTLIAIPYGILISRHYFKRVLYICPECHEIFKPSMKQAFWANHTPTTRKLTCTKCGHRGFCVETYKEEK